jgi:hypothetical protein
MKTDKGSQCDVGNMVRALILNSSVFKSNAKKEKQ